MRDTQEEPALQALPGYQYAQHTCPPPSTSLVGRGLPGSLYVGVLCPST